jgi:hypothetical protein
MPDELSKEPLTAFWVVFELSEFAAKVGDLFHVEQRNAETFPGVVPVALNVFSARIALRTILEETGRVNPKTLVNGRISDNGHVGHFGFPLLNK